MPIQPLDNRIPGTITVGDLHVRRFGYGAMRITGTGIWGPPANRAEALAVLRRAHALGVNMIDTADSYGPHVSEELIAEALHPYPGDLAIATKGGFVRDGPGKWRPNGRPEHLRQACEASLRRLRVEQIDLYQLHVPDPEVPYEESVGALKELQAEGKIRNVGVSNVGLEELATARKTVDVVAVQNRFNLSDRSAEDLLAFCEAEGIAFIPWRPLGAGSLAEPGGRTAEIAARHGVSSAQVALAWLLTFEAMLPIPGTGSVTHLEENISAASIELSEAEVVALSTN